MEEIKYKVTYEGKESSSIGGFPKVRMPYGSYSIELDEAVVAERGPYTCKGLHELVKGLIQDGKIDREKDFTIIIKQE